MDCVAHRHSHRAGWQPTARSQFRRTGFERRLERIHAFDFELTLKNLFAATHEQRVADKTQIRAGTAGRRQNHVHPAGLVAHLHTEAGCDVQPAIAINRQTGEIDPNKVDL